MFQAVVLVDPSNTGQLSLILTELHCRFYCEKFSALTNFSLKVGFLILPLIYTQ